MSPDTLTEEQQAWTRRVLGLLGRRGRSTDGEETGDAPPETDGEMTAKRYGGYEDLKFDTRKAPKPLRMALARKPPCMVTVADWNEMAVSVEDVLSKYSDGKITKIKENLNQAGRNKKKFNRGRKECLALLDAKENNPERARIGLLLSNWEQEETDYNEEKSKTGLTQDLIDRKHQRLAAFQKQLLDWNDRRAQQNLPPSLESVALGDLLQKVHQDFIADVVHNDLDLPITGGDQLTETERAEVQQTWRNLQSGEPGGDGNRIVIPKAPQGFAKSQEDADRFRNQVLSNFALLLQSEVGRGLVRKLNASGHCVDIRAGYQAECEFDSKDARPTDSSSEQQAKETRGVGAKATVELVLDGKDSDVALTTQSGNMLYAPRFIAMGHELVHAMHVGRGIERTNVPRPFVAQNDKWDDQEEYQTIHRGKTSEQSIRNQYGLSAERWGHSEVAPTAPLGQSLQDELDATASIGSEGREKVNEAVIKLGFDPSALGDKIKWGIYKAGATLANHGTMLANLEWDANKLTVPQMQGIVANNINNTLDRIGWTPYQLPKVIGRYPSIQTVVSAKRHHPRSPKGRRFRTLGEKATLDVIPDFNRNAGTTLPTGAGNDWELKLEALETAENHLIQVCNDNPIVKEALKGKMKLKTRLEEAGPILFQTRNQQK